MILSFRQHITMLNDLIKKYNIVALVVGWPLELNSTVGQQCRIVQRHCTLLHDLAHEMKREQQEQEEQQKMDVHFSELQMLVWDERWSTEFVRHEPKRTANEHTIKRRFKRSSIGKPFEDDSNNAVDDRAAAFILHNVLDWIREDEYERDLVMDGLEHFRPPV